MAGTVVLCADSADIILKQELLPSLLYKEGNDFPKLQSAQYVRHHRVLSAPWTTVLAASLSGLAPGLLTRPLLDGGAFDCL